jgi:hypothetical protein
MFARLTQSILLGKNLMKLRSEQPGNLPKCEHDGCSVELCQRGHAGRPFSRVTLHSHVGLGLGLLKLGRGLAMLCFFSLPTLVDKL